jgi:hypothetical protein
MNRQNDNLARNVISLNADSPEAFIAPSVNGTSMLDRCLSKLCEHIENMGLSSFYWVAGVHTEEIAERILKSMALAKDKFKFDGNSCVIVAKPAETKSLRTFEAQYKFRILSMNEVYTDSFIAINNSAVLDVTPMIRSEGRPEFCEESTVAGLYTGLFNILRDVTTS